MAVQRASLLARGLRLLTLSIHANILRLCRGIGLRGRLRHSDRVSAAGGGTDVATRRCCRRRTLQSAGPAVRLSRTGSAPAVPLAGGVVAKADKDRLHPFFRSAWATPRVAG